MDGDRVEDPLDRGPANLADVDRVVAHALHDLERVPVGAAILVDRQGLPASRVTSKYMEGSCPHLRGILGAAGRLGARLPALKSAPVAVEEVLCQRMRLA